MKNRFDRFLNKQNIVFSKEEIDKIELLKVDYANKLYEGFTYDYEMFDCETSTHPTSASKINALERIKQDIENGKIFDKSYFDVLELKGATVNYNDQKFIEFAVGYSILEHDCAQTAFIALKEIWQVHLLNLMILEYHKNEYSLTTNYFKINMGFDDKVFPNTKSHQFFIQTINRAEFEISRNWISQLYRFLKSKTKHNPNCHIKGTEFEFADYWNKYNCGYIIKKYDKSTGMASQNSESNEYELIRSWYKNFN